jgi:branched-chain amino acid transport system permease protein
LKRATLAALALAVLVFPLVVRLPFPRHVLIMTFLYGSLAVAWNLLAGYCGQISLGHAIFFGIGAYAPALLVRDLALTPWLGMLAGAALAVIASQAIGYPVFRLRGHYFAIATVAMWMIAQPIGATWELINGSRGLFIPIEPARGLAHGFLTLQFPGRAKGLGFYYVSLALFALVMWGARAVERSKLGYYFHAIRDDQEGAEGIGINSRLYKVAARCVMAAIFGVGGVLYSFWALAVFPDQVLDVNWNVLPMMAAVVGGIGHLWGPVLGAVILIPISQLMTATLGAGPLAGRGIDLIIYGVIIMVIAGGRPNGLLSLPWGRWIARLTGAAAPGLARPASGDRPGAR